MTGLLTGRGSYRFSPGNMLASMVEVQLLRELKQKVTESTVHPIKKDFIERLKRKKSTEDGDVKVLPWRKQGRPLLLGEHLYHRVQLYLKKVRDKSFSEPIQQLLKARSK